MHAHPRARLRLRFSWGNQQGVGGGGKKDVLLFLGVFFPEGKEKKKKKEGVAWVMFTWKRGWCGLGEEVSCIRD